jgi:uncharacterized protein (DUF433 family)
MQKCNIVNGANMATEWNQRIAVNPKIFVGKPATKGTRIAVEFVLEKTTDGWSMADILNAYPNLAREDVLAAHSFAAELFKEATFVAAGKQAA